MIRGFIFDLDGVICSTDEFHYLAWKEAAEDLGVYFDREINNRLRGVSRMDSLNIILERYDGSLTEAEKLTVAEKKNNIYRKLLNNMTSDSVEPDTLYTLKELKNAGYKLAIGSSSKNAPFILTKIGLSGFFHAVSDGNNITKSKPDPEVFIKAADFIGLSPAECFVIEDAVAGIDAANAGGFISVAMGDAFNYPKAQKRISAFKELLYLIN